MKWLKLAILNWCLKDLWKAPTEESYLKVDQVRGTILLLDDENSKNGEALSKADVDEYISEARTINRLPLFKKVNESMRNVAKNMIFNKSKTIDDIIAGKMVLWTLEVIDKKYDSIEKLRP